MNVPMLGAIVAISALVAWILFHLAHGGVVAAEQRSRGTTAQGEPPAADVELLHALRALYKRMYFTAYLCGAALAGGGVAAVQWSSLGPGGRVVTGGVLLVVLALPMMFAPRPVATGYARARGISRAELRSRRTTVFRVIWMLIAAWPVPVAFAVEPMVVDRVFFAAVAYLLALPLAVGVLAPFMVRLLAPHPITPDIAARLTAVASRAGIRLLTTRVIASRTRKVANALQVGWLPGLQWVVMTDYLLDSLTDADVDAVFAHELGHARGHDTWKRSALAGAMLFCLSCTIISGLAQAPNLLLAIGGLATAAVLGRVQRQIAVR
ncbi:MAG TPA: M48 family metalloprotease, partial [Acidothermaceae bacterium]